MQAIAVPFIAGLHGTWLIWFINEHKNFVKYTLFDRTIDYATPLSSSGITDYGIGPGWWHMQNIPDDYDTLVDRPDEIEQCQTWAEFVDEDRDNWLNPDATKIAVKFFPHHAFNDQEHRAHLVFKDCNANSAVIPYVDTVFHDELEARWDILVKPMLGDNMDDIDARKELKWVEDIIPVHWVDIGKLLTKDRQEYNKLLSFIGEEPLDDWELKCDRVLRDIYGKTV